MTRGYEPDFRKAADILRQLSSQMPQAAARLGRLYMDGRGVGGKDYNLAYKYLKQVSFRWKWTVFRKQEVINVGTGSQKFDTSYAIDNFRQKTKRTQWE